MQFIERINIFKHWKEFKAKQNKIVAFLLDIIEFIVILVTLAIILHQGFIQRRYIPSKSMMPYLQVNDHLIVERVSLNAKRFFNIGKGFQRGDVVVFYPPFLELKNTPMHIFGRLSGFSREVRVGPFQPFFFLPKTADAYIKRIVALPGEKVEVRKGDGIYINGKKLIEKYPPTPGGGDTKLYNFPLEKPNYSIKYLTDIPYLSPTFQGSGEIIVPEGHYFCLGDNRNNSFDGHAWGFVPRERIIAKAHAVIWRNLKQFRFSLEKPEELMLPK